jgi:hypothetical protein
MKSPFPGMDPYLEAHWLDVHPRLIVAASTAIQEQLGDDLVARIEERLLAEDALGPVRRIGPDVSVVEFGMPGKSSAPLSRSGAGRACNLSYSVRPGEAALY